jgi:hypothetical protein
LPPDEERPGLHRALNAGARAELVDTAVAILADGRPFDDLLTTSATLQSGAVELLYARRDVIGMLAARAYGPALAATIRARLASVDLDAPPRWVERGGVYSGTGLFLPTPAATAAIPTYRNMVKMVLYNFLCTRFHSVHVDSASLVAAVGSAHGDLRALRAGGDSPMRHQPACVGCHAPLDGGAAFLAGMETPLHGSYPTGLAGDGELFVDGGKDLRGRGHGYDGLARLLVRQPEVERCVVTTTFRALVARPPVAGDEEEIRDLLSVYRAGGHAFPPLLRAILLGPAWRRVHGGLR